MRFAHLKIYHGFERMRLRGLSGARDEFHLAAIVQNLKTLALRSIGPPVTPQQRENPRTDQVTATAGTGSKSHPTVQSKAPTDKTATFSTASVNRAEAVRALRRRMSRCSPQAVSSRRHLECLRAARHKMTQWANNRLTQRSKQISSFDHLVSLGEHQNWDLKAEGVSGLEIDHQFYLGALLDWQVSRLGALENFPATPRRSGASDFSKIEAQLPSR
jgi:hypothetical protein